MKHFWALALLILDVVAFPRGCSKNKPQVAVFNSYQYIEEIDDYIGTIYTCELTDSIAIPSEVVLSEKGYQISYWSLSEESEDPVSFPYAYQEEDIQGYYHGHRNCVVFFAHWELVEA